MELLHEPGEPFGKGGACSTIESLFMRKPVMYYMFVCGNEKQSVKFVKENRLGWYVPSVRSYLRQLVMILEDPEIVRGIDERYKKYDFKSGTDNLCRMIVDMMEAV